MRSDSIAFTSLNGTPAKKPRFVLRINFGTKSVPDYVYFPSTDDIPNVPTDGVIHTGLIEKLSGTSQQLDLSTGINKIGDMNFTLVDKDYVLSDLLADKDTNGKGIRKKQVRFYYGYKDLDFSEFATIQTQEIEKDLSISGASYTFRCNDKQRGLTAKIFKEVKTNLYQTMDSEQLYMFVYGVDDFEWNDQGAGYSDAPNQKVFYTRVDNEMMRITNAVSDISLGIPLYKLTIGARSVLGTTPSEHVVDSNDTKDARPDVVQVPYLEGSAFDMLYSVITGVHYNDPTKTFPSNWSALLGEDSIRISDFVNIGLDFWDTTDDNAGKVLKFIGEEVQTAKAFIESQLLELYSTFIPIRGDGNLGLARASNVLTDAPYTLTFDESNVVKVLSYSHRLSEVINLVQLGWAYDSIDKEFERNPILIDQESIDKHHISVLKTKKFRGLSTSRHSATEIKNVFDMVRDRFSAPPIYIELELLPSNNVVEVGDAHRVKLAKVRDHTGKTIALDRTMEVQRVSIDWITGKIRVLMFGSTQKAAPITFNEGDRVLSDDYFNAALNGGTDFSTIPGATFTGGALHLTANTTLTGHDDVNNATAIYSYVGNVVIDSGVTITTTKNVQFRISEEFKGVNGGKIDAKGQGHAGRAGVGWTEADVLAGDASVGYLGSSEAQGGFSEFPTLYTYSGYKLIIKGYVLRGARTVGERDKIPLFNLGVTSNNITGLPNDLQGVPGAGGTGLNYTTGAIQLTGGVGGGSGGAVQITARSCVFETSFLTDVSGNDGVLGSEATVASTTSSINSGAGAGGNTGVLLVLIDGNSNPPNITTNNFIALTGKMPLRAANIIDLKHNVGVGELLTPPKDYTAYTEVTPKIGEAFDMHSSAYRVQYLNTLELVEGNTPKRSIAPVNVTISELNNTPKSALGNLSTLTISYTKDASDNGYSYSKVYYRVLGSSQWFLGGASASSVDIVLTSDGTQYEFEIRSVSKHNIESTGGAYATYTVSDVENSIDETVLNSPNVSGLELFEQGNDTEFTGRIAKFAWDKNSLNDWYSLGYEPLAQGSGAGDTDLFFKDYECRIYNGATLLRTEYVTDTWYNYDWERNTEDTKGNPVRAFRLEVRQRSKLNKYSEYAAKLEVSNPAPSLSTAVRFDALYSAVMFSHTIPKDLDWKSVKIYFSDTSGFTADETTLVHEGNDAQVTLGENLGMVSGTEYFFRYRNVDEFGNGELSSEFSETTGYIPGGNVSLTESLIVAGDAANYHLRLGPEYVLADDKTFVMRYTNLTTDLFTMDELGNSKYRGDIELIGDDSFIRSGQTAFNVGVGWWFGREAGIPKISLNSGDEKGFTFDGDDFKLLKKSKMLGGDGYYNNNFYIHLTPYNSLAENADYQETNADSQTNFTYAWGRLRLKAVCKTGGLFTKNAVSYKYESIDTPTFNKNRRIKFVVNDSFVVTSGSAIYALTMGVPPNYSGSATYIGVLVYNNGDVKIHTSRNDSGVIGQVTIGAIKQIEIDYNSVTQVVTVSLDNVLMGTHTVTGVFSIPDSTVFASVECSPTSVLSDSVTVDILDIKFMQDE